MKALRETLGKGVLKATAFITLAAARANMVMCDAFSDAETGVGNLQTKLVSLGKKLFPLAIVICAVAMFFTRDQKKFDVEKRILVGCCLAMALLVIVQKGNLVSTIEGLF